MLDFDRARLASGPLRRARRTPQPAPAGALAAQARSRRPAGGRRGRGGVPRRLRGGDGGPVRVLIVLPGRHRRRRPRAAAARPDPPRTAGRAHRLGGRAALGAAPRGASVARRALVFRAARRGARGSRRSSRRLRAGAIGRRARSRTRAEERVPRTRRPGRPVRIGFARADAREGAWLLATRAPAPAGRRAPEARAVPRLRRRARPAAGARRVRPRADGRGGGAGRGAARGTAPAVRRGVRRLVVPGAPLVPGARRRRCSTRSATRTRRRRRAPRHAAPTPRSARRWRARARRPCAISSDARRCAS